MIDRSLNYGRHHIDSFLRRAMPYKRVLDIGAGTGTDLEAAKTVNQNSELFALEYYPPNVATLREKGITIFQNDLETEWWPLEDETIDVIIANQILEHTKELFWIFHECSRVLAVEGSLIIGVPNLASLHNRLLLCAGRQPTPIQLYSAHIRGFTKEGLQQFLNHCFPCGYALEGFGGSNFYPFPPLLARPLAKMFPILAWGSFFLLRKKRAYHREFLDYPDSRQLETNFFLGKK